MTAEASLRGRLAAHTRSLDVLSESIEFGPDCWLWTGSMHPAGYGRVYIGDRNYRRAHRVVYEAVVGPIPEGLHIDHLCRNRACVNPDHLEPVTCRENVLRGVGPSAENAAKTHCPKGHPFEGENLLLWGDGKRRCRICMKEWWQTRGRVLRQRRKPQ